MSKSSQECWNSIDRYGECVYDLHYVPLIESDSSASQKIIQHKVSVDTKITLVKTKLCATYNFTTGSNGQHLWTVKVYARRKHSLTSMQIAFKLNTGNNNSIKCIFIKDELSEEVKFNNGLIRFWKIKLGKLSPDDLSLERNLTFQFIVKEEINSQVHLFAQQGPATSHSALTFQPYAGRLNQTIEPFISYNDNIELFVLEDCDIILCTNDGYELRTHKKILSKHSNVFKTIFQENMNYLRITDYNKDAVLGMLKYIYGGNINNFNIIGEKLLMLSHKYEMNDLKSDCLSYISRHLSSSNVLQYFQMAEIHGFTELRDNCMNVIKDTNNLLKIMNTEEWIKMKETTPLVCYVIQNMAGIKF